MSGLRLDTIVQADALELCHAAADAGIQADMILCDLPYGTTACAWDTVIPFAPMWEAFKRLIKPRGAIVLTASQPFTSALVMSNPAWFRYELIWEKTMAMGFLDANRKPLRSHENVLIFAQGLTTYNPVMEDGEPYRKSNTGNRAVHMRGDFGAYEAVNDGTRFPRSVLKVSNGNNFSLHPTQKPVDLFRYLIRTYTFPGETVVDPTCGSGTTAYSARQEGRHWLCGDSSAEYVRVAQERMAAPYTPDMFVLQEMAK